VLFSGTLRSNLDPFNLYDDERLYDAMKRACLMELKAEGEGEAGGGGRKRFTLDMAIDDEGSNLSIGERSLASLARALAKDAQIVVLDEATAAVDLLTDSRIQNTIRTEFVGKTLLCIAHRLRTIISWDRILVMDAGEIEDFDTPLNLYDKGGLFHTMCERSHITREEIIRARKEERDIGEE
jgi:ABC-type multidrug transport system fused ATPase/permease subunit